MNLIQIFFRDRVQEQEPLPPLLDQATKSAQAAFSDHRYYLFDLTTAGDFIATRFERKVSKALEASSPMPTNQI